MSCCTEIIDLCEISSCENWIKTDIELGAVNPNLFKATVGFNGVQLTCETSSQGGYLSIKNSLNPNYSYTLKVEKTTGDYVLKCYSFKLILNKNL